MNTEECRHCFEQWVIDKCLKAGVKFEDIDLVRAADGEYRLAHTQTAWEVWSDAWSCAIR